MQSGIVMTEQDLKDYGRSIAEETARKIIQQLTELGAIAEPEPEYLSSKDVRKKYGIGNTTLCKWRDLIADEYGDTNPIYHKTGNKIYHNPVLLDKWVMGRFKAKEERKKIDPRMEDM